MRDMDKDFKVSRRSNWILLMAALGFTGYSAYTIYHFPSIARKRAKISKFFAALSSAASAFSASADCVATISKDLKEFLHSDSDEIPHSLKQIAKLARSDEISNSLTRLSQAITLGIFRGYDQYSRGGGKENENEKSSNFTDRIMEKLCSESGCGFVSVVVGSFARNLVMALMEASKSGSSSLERWMGVVVCDGKSRELIGELIRMFVSSAVSVYLEKTMEINTFDQIFSGLTNPKHEKEMRELLVCLSNGAVKTLIKTSHQVLLSGHGNWAMEAGPGPGKKVEELEEMEMGLKPKREYGKRPRNGGWGKNKKVIVNWTGRMTFEMVRSFIEVLLERIYEGMKRCVDIVNEEVIERGLEIVRYVASKTSVIATICLSLCFHVLDTTSWFLLAY
ncbi:protein PHLOEM PROTEIN 2-LIKE A10-like [Benincasa hispida]|uniref:protein PHLOEM PROTEIN 2-LIKE A10-like n=1 Tax=Benincasa hispida TaxID=102211 RepID=UPI0019011880|nr:protein PHLOEM PROTEIN 2-LIKE A10-like [Benincasa hispida]